MHIVAHTAKVKDLSSRPCCGLQNGGVDLSCQWSAHDLAHNVARICSLVDHSVDAIHDRRRDAQLPVQHHCISCDKVPGNQAVECLTTLSDVLG